MNRRHALVISLFLAFALVLGTFATLRTTALGVHARAVPNAQIAAKSRQLDRYAARLAREAKRRPPAVSSATPAAQQPQIVYRRPAPVVHAVHRHGGDDAHESGGFDD